MMEYWIIGLLTGSALALAVLLEKTHRLAKEALARCANLAEGNSRLVDQLRAAREGGKNPARTRILELVYEEPEEKRAGLNVPADDPLLRSVLTLMNAMEQVHIESGSVVGLTPDEAKAELRCVASLQELAEIVLEETEKARKENK